MSSNTIEELAGTPALLAGATGLVGREIAAQWPGPMRLLVRRPLPSRPGRTPMVVDFAALPELPAAEIAFCALGTTIKVAGSQAAFRAVDFAAVLAFANAAKAAGVTRFGAVSALGADARSSNFYSRVKGEAEAALRLLGFEVLVLARPSLLAGDRGALGQPERRGEQIGQRVAGWLGPLVPAGLKPIEAEVLARALIRATATAERGVQVLDSASLQRQGARA